MFGQMNRQTNSWPNRWNFDGDPDSFIDSEWHSGIIYHYVAASRYGVNWNLQCQRFTADFDDIFGGAESSQQIECLATWAWIGLAILGSWIQMSTRRSWQSSAEIHALVSTIRHQLFSSLLAESELCVGFDSTLAQLTTSRLYAPQLPAGTARARISYGRLSVRLGCHDHVR